MSLLRLSKLATLLVPTACVLVACMGSDVPTSTGGHGGRGEGGMGGEGGTITLISTNTNTGPGGPTSSSSGPEAGTSHCVGDTGAWEQLTPASIPCTTGEECCVIMDPCLREAQVVAAMHSKDALEVWPSCAVDCHDCLARAIEVACISGSCLGRVTLKESPTSMLRHDHCGTALEFTKPYFGETGVHFTCATTSGTGP